MNEAEALEQLASLNHLDLARVETLGADAISSLAGIGPYWTERLAELGILRLADLAFFPADTLSRLEGLGSERALRWVLDAQAEIHVRSLTAPVEVPAIEDSRADLKLDEAAMVPSLIEESPVNYEVIDRASLRGKRRYALLDQLANEWRVITRPLEDYDTPPDPRHTFGMERPSFQWVKDGKSIEIYVEGMDQFAFYESLGLDVDLKNATTSSKRISRLFRPQAVTGFFDEVKRRYLDEVFPEGTSDHDEKTWDGAGLVSRKILLKMIEQLPENLDPRSRARIERELRKAQRVEFTIMTSEGQEKGHAIVHETMEDDFVLPRDIKGQVKLKGGKDYVAFEFPHGAEDMRIDIQSLINMHPFFDEGQLISWMRQEGEVFMDAVKSGDIAEAMRRVDAYTTVEDLEQWSLREFLVSGGDIHWSGSHVKSFFRSAIKRLQKMGDGGAWDEQGDFIRNGKIRVPIPGGRSYVMPAAVGRAAGKKIEVQRGEVFIDSDAGTAWINDKDWYELQDGADVWETKDDGSQLRKPQGVAEILGGGDNDDALWVHHFTDHDGLQKTMVWRSPNQAGEYVILKPSEASSKLAWQSREGQIVFPDADSRKLPKRRDHQQADGELEVLGLIEQVNPGSDIPESGLIGDAMRRAAEREKINKDILGADCNWMMLHKTVYGEAPRTVPDYLETVIDVKKTGFNGGPVLEWVQKEVGKMLEQKMPIPELIHSRLGHRRPGTPAPRKTLDHWMDRLQEGFRQQLAALKEARHSYAEDTLPPMEVFEFVHASHKAAQADSNAPDYFRLGKKVNSLYYQTLNAAKSKGAGSAALETARLKVEDYLKAYPPDVQEGIMLGTLVASYAKDETDKTESSGYDGVAWLMGSKDSIGRRQSGLANVTMNALRRLGVLNQLDEGEGGIYSYPSAQIRDRSHSTMRINAVHRAFFNFAAEREGRRLYEQYDKDNPADVEERKTYAKKAREQVAQFARSGQTVDLEVRPISIGGKERLALFSRRTGKQFGTIDESDQHRYQAGETLSFKGGFSRGGDIAAFIQRQQAPAVEENES